MPTDPPLEWWPVFCGHPRKERVMKRSSIIAVGLLVLGTYALVRAQVATPPAKELPAAASSRWADNGPVQGIRRLRSYQASESPQPHAPGRFQLIGESGWVYRIDTATGEVVGMPVGAQAWNRLVRVIEVTSVIEATSEEPARNDPGVMPYYPVKPSSEAPTEQTGSTASPQ